MVWLMTKNFQHFQIYYQHSDLDWKLSKSKFSISSRLVEISSSFAERGLKYYLPCSHVPVPLSNCCWMLVCVWSTIQKTIRGGLHSLWESWSGITVFYNNLFHSQPHFFYFSWKRGDIFSWAGYQVKMKEGNAN